MIKKGRGEELWNDKPNKKRHKDIDARWTKKITRRFTGIKIMQKLTIKVNLPRRIIILNNGCIIKMKYPTG